MSLGLLISIAYAVIAVVVLLMVVFWLVSIIARISDGESCECGKVVMFRSLYCPKCGWPLPSVRRRWKRRLVSRLLERQRGQACGRPRPTPAGPPSQREPDAMPAMLPPGWRYDVTRRHR